jgi:DNA-binding XRE family transcriptional regulator
MSVTFVMETVYGVDKAALRPYVSWVETQTRGDAGTSFYQAVGRRIREARLAQTPSLTQEGLANLVGLTRTSITNLEQGRQKCLIHTLVDIAYVLRVQPGSLLPDDAPPEPTGNPNLRNLPKTARDWVQNVMTRNVEQRSSHGA